MSNVLQFRQKPKQETLQADEVLVWMCGCGCPAFTLHSDGHVACVQCGHVPCCIGVDLPPPPKGAA